MTQRDGAEWLFDVDQKHSTSHYELSFGRVKVFLYENLHRNITHHNVPQCFRQLKLLAQETSLDPYILFRYIFILLETNPTEQVHKNVVIYLESLLSKLDLSKPDIFVEYLAYFFRHNRIDDARDLFNSRRRHIFRQSHRPLPCVDANLGCYAFLLNYLEWLDKTRTKEVFFDVSIQGWLVNAIEYLKFVDTNHEYFVMCLVRVLLYYGYSKKAYIITRNFVSNNPDNISAQILLLRLVEWLKDRSENSGNGSRLRAVPEEIELNLKKEIEEINNFGPKEDEDVFSDLDFLPIGLDEISARKAIRRLDVTRREVEGVFDHHTSLVEVFVDLMDAMENIPEIRSTRRWKGIRQVVRNILKTHDEETISGAKSIWHARYRRFWRTVDFVALAGPTASERKVALIGDVISMLFDNFDEPLD